jgi:L-ascorbate metabolism protein UlaG (beta-lactamase superfamily)
MKPAFRKDEALLGEVREALATRARRIWWLGQSGFLLTHHGRAVLLDPYLSDSLTRKYAGTDKPHVRITERVVDPAALGSLGVIDVVTSSHTHTDHLDAETLIPILQANPGARLVFPEANLETVLERLGGWVQPQLLGCDAGVTRPWGGLNITGIPAAHNELERDLAGRCRFLGFLIQWGGLSLYHSGDTLWHPAILEALRPHRIDVALLPINGNRPERRVAGNLSGLEAARLARELRAGLVIPCHFDLFEFNTASPVEFMEECRRLEQPFAVLRPGEGMEL